MVLRIDAHVQEKEKHTDSLTHSLSLSLSHTHTHTYTHIHIHTYIYIYIYIKHYIYIHMHLCVCIGHATRYHFIVIQNPVVMVTIRRYSTSLKVHSSNVTTTLPCKETIAKRFVFSLQIDKMSING